MNGIVKLFITFNLFRMNKKSYSNVELILRLQQNEPEGWHSYRGVFTLTGENKFLFEEAAYRQQSVVRNPKLFVGEYISLVHKQNGRYQVHCRTINPSQGLDVSDLAFKVYSELLTALRQID